MFPKHMVVVLCKTLLYTSFIIYFGYKLSVTNRAVKIKKTPNPSREFERQHSISIVFNNMQSVIRFLHVPRTNDWCRSSPSQQKRTEYPPTVLIFVMTKAERVELRRAVRETWANNAKTPVIFILSNSYQLDQMRAVEEESLIFGDLLVLGHNDSDKAIAVFETYAAMLWKTQNAACVPFMLKVGSESSIVLVDNLLKFCNARLKLNVAMNTIYGNVYEYVRTIRTNSSRWFVPPEVYARAYYPTYTNGMAYLLTSDVPYRLLAETRNQKFFPIEDAFFTGVLAERAVVERVHYGLFAQVFLNDSDAKTGIVLSAPLDPARLKDAYESLL